MDTYYTVSAESGYNAAASDAKRWMAYFGHEQADQWLQRDGIEAHVAGSETVDIRSMYLPQELEAVSKDEARAQWVETDPYHGLRDASGVNTAYGVWVGQQLIAGIRLSTMANASKWGAELLKEPAVYIADIAVDTSMTSHNSYGYDASYMDVLQNTNAATLRSELHLLADVMARRHGIERVRYEGTDELARGTYAHDSLYVVGTVPGWHYNLLLERYAMACGSARLLGTEYMTERERADWQQAREAQKNAVVQSAGSLLWRLAEISDEGSIQDIRKQRSDEIYARYGLQQQPGERLGLREDIQAGKVYVWEDTQAGRLAHSFTLDDSSYKWPANLQADAVFLRGLQTDLNYKGRSIGIESFDAINAVAYAFGKAALRFDAWTSNPRLHHYYEGLGARYQGLSEKMDVGSRALFEYRVQPAFEPLTMAVNAIEIVDLLGDQPQTDRPEPRAESVEVAAALRQIFSSDKCSK